MSDDMACPSPYSGASIARLNSQTAWSLLSDAFQKFTEVCPGNESSESRRKLLSECEDKWQAQGLHGENAVNLLSQLRQQIAWETMAPDQFAAFYRFAFCICKESKRKHVKLSVALALWRLILGGRFRLLDRWCDFMQQRLDTVKVINEDQWRQVLDFSRTVFEDLSNFDPTGAWVCILDDFVEHLHRPQHPHLGYQGSGSCGRSEYGTREAGSSAGVLLGDSSLQHMRSVQPSCGSKRKGPSAEVDNVAEQLSTLPLSSAGSADLDMSLSRKLEVSPLKMQCISPSSAGRSLRSSMEGVVASYQYPGLNAASFPNQPQPPNLPLQQLLFLQQQQQQQQMLQQPMDTNMGECAAGMQDLPQLPALLTAIPTSGPSRRVLRTRRSNANLAAAAVVESPGSLSDLINGTVSDALGLY